MPEPATTSLPPVAAQAGRSGGSALLRDLWSRPYRQAASWVVPVALLAYGFAMANFTLAGDDWFAVYPEVDLDRDYLLWAGRWATPLLWKVTGDGAFVPPFTLAVCLAILVLAGLMAASAWRLTRARSVFAVVALMVSSPLLADKLNFKPVHLSSPLAMVAAVAAGWLIVRGRAARGWRIAAAGGLLVWTLATYQPTGLVFAVIVLGDEVRRAVEEGAGYWRAAWPRWLTAAAAAAAGVAGYVASVPLAWWVTGTDPDEAHAAYSLVGGYPSTLGQAADSIRLALRTAGRFWFGTTALYPVALKALGLGLVGVGTATAVVLSGRGGAGRRARWATRGWLVVLGVASTLVPFTAIVLRLDPPLRANMFTTVGLVTGFWAGFLLERLGGTASGRRARMGGAAALAVVLLLAAGGAFQTSKGFVGLYLSNQRDLANANRMLSVMEQMPQFAEGEEIRIEVVGKIRFAVAGAPFSNEVAGTPITSIVNCSGLACQNHLVDMLNMIGGGERPFVARRVSGRPAVSEVVAGMPSWPQPGSIRYLAGSFVIKGG